LLALVLVASFALTIGAAGADAVTTPTTFATLDKPFGVTVGTNGNVFVTYDGLQTTYLAKFSPNGDKLNETTIGDETVGDIGKLATDPVTGKIWDLGTNGVLRLVDPTTLSYSTLKDVKTVDISTSVSSAWDVASDMNWGTGGAVAPGSSSFGDIALYRSGDGYVYAFVTARTGSTNVPYVLRLKFNASQPGPPVYEGATLVVWSSYRGELGLPGGVAVNPSGLVIATLPRKGLQGEGSCCTDQAVSFPYDFPKPGVIPTGELNRWDMQANGIASDSQGWFYLTGVIGTSKCGDKASAAITVLGAQRDFRACYARSTIAWGNDVAVTPSGGNAYSTISCDPRICTENLVLKWGRLDGFSLLVGTNSGAGLGTVTSSTPAGAIDCPPQCQAVFDPGTAVTLNAQPDFAGYRFDGWSGEGCSGTGNCTVTMDAAKRVAARFEAFEAPRTASYLRVSLVPDFRQTISTTQCQARGGTPSSHGTPLSFTSCNPPSVPRAQAHFGPQGSGWAQLSSIYGDPYDPTAPGDIGITVGSDDIRGGSPTGPAYDPNSVGPDMTMRVKLRISDTYNGPDHVLPATLIDNLIGADVRCVPSWFTSGSMCNVATTANALVGDNGFHINRHTVIQAFRMRLFDSGADGVYNNSDDTSFATQGIYIP
jgi:hypothetical protein